MKNNLSLPNLSNLAPRSLKNNSNDASSEVYGTDEKFASSMKKSKFSICLPQLGASKSVEAFSLLSEATLEST